MSTRTEAAGLMLRGLARAAPLLLGAVALFFAFCVPGFAAVVGGMLLALCVLAIAGLDA